MADYYMDQMSDPDFGDGWQGVCSVDEAICTYCTPTHYGNDYQDRSTDPLQAASDWAEMDIVNHLSSEHGIEV